MELDNLKELWKDSNKSSIPIDENKLRQILSTSSNGPIAKMKRNLKLEVISLIIVYGLLLWETSNEVDSIFTTFDFVLLLVTGMLFIISVNPLSIYAKIQLNLKKNEQIVDFSYQMTTDGKQQCIWILDSIGQVWKCINDLTINFFSWELSKVGLIESN